MVRRSVPLLLACLLVLTSCSGAADSAAPTTTSVSVGATSSTESAPPPELAFAEQLKDEVRLALVRPASFLPFEVAPLDESGVVVADLLYDGLVETVGLEDEVRPGLARSWSANDDFTRWVFELDPDRSVTADVVVASLRALGDKALPGSIRVVVNEISGVEAVDESTVAIDLVAPNAGLPWLLTGLVFSIVGPDGATTGQYVAVSDDDERMVLEPVSGQQGPTVEVMWEETASDAYDQLVLAQVDAAVVEKDDLEDAERRFGSTFPARSISRFYVLSRSSSDLQTVEQRYSVLGSINREEVVDWAFTTPVRLSKGVVPPTVAGYAGADCEEICGLDLSGVGPLDQGGEGGPAPEIVVAYSGDDQVPVGEWVAGDLRSGGYRARAQQFDSSELGQAIVADKVDVFAFGWVAASGSIDAIVPYLFSPRSSANVARINLSEVQDLIDRARATEDDRTRWRLYTEAHDLAMADGVILPLASAVTTLARAPHAASLVIRSDGSLDLMTTGG